MAPTETKIGINGTTSGFNPTTQDQITLALLQNGGVKRIQTTFQQRLDEAGWTQTLRETVESLFRSGEATTYDDALRIVTAKIALQGEEDGVADGGLVIPREVARDAADAVKREVKAVCKVE